ncbi:MAG TPA: hypothetical protein VFV53_05100, partial [Candidatus Limnocylindrales bacterium]|nr:hypothetical protein [Candidatus Limnocylindrales bacterium]
GDPTTASGEPSPVSGEPSPAPDPAPSLDPGASSDPPGLRDQIAAVIAAARRLVTAHWELAKAELGQIMGEVGRAVALGCLAAAMVLLAGMLLGIGLFLFLGEWIFGSIGWGVLLGPLLLIDVAAVAGLIAVGLPGRRIGFAFLIALAIGVVTGIVLGLDLTNRAWTAVGDSLMPGVDIGFRPLAIAVLSLALIGGVIGLISGLRAQSGSAVAGLFVGAFAGIVLGVLTAVALGPRVGAAFGALTTLIAWPALMGLDVSRTGIDGDALKARFYPGTTIETTKETIEWVRQRTPLGRKS